MAARLAAYSLTADDNTEATWAASEVAVLIRYVGATTVAGMILSRAQRELESLATPAEAATPSRVVGPFRLPKAA